MFNCECLSKLTLRSKMRTIEHRFLGQVPRIGDVVQRSLIALGSSAPPSTWRRCAAGRASLRVACLELALAPVAPAAPASIILSRAAVFMLLVLALSQLCPFAHDWGHITSILDCNLVLSGSWHCSCKFKGADPRCLQRLGVARVPILDCPSIAWCAATAATLEHVWCCIQ